MERVYAKLKEKAKGSQGFVPPTKSLRKRPAEPSTTQQTELPQKAAAGPSRPAVVRIPSDQSQGAEIPADAPEHMAPQVGEPTLVGNTRASYEWMMNMRPQADVAMAEAHTNTGLVRATCNSFAMLGCYAVSVISRFEEMSSAYDVLKQRYTRLKDNRAEDREQVRLAQGEVMNARATLQEQQAETTRLREELARVSEENVRYAEEINSLLSTSADGKKVAVEEFKASEQYEDELTDFAAHSYAMGFNDCKVEVGKLFPEVDLEKVQISSGDKDADKGEGPAE